MEPDPECVRCGRSEGEHLAQDRGEASEVRVRIWRALGFPCPQFVPVGAIFTPDQAATSRWARRPQPTAVGTAQPGPRGDTYSQGAALARQMLRQRNDHQGATA